MVYVHRGRGRALGPSHTTPGRVLSFSFISLYLFNSMPSINKMKAASLQVRRESGRAQRSVHAGP